MSNENKPITREDSQDRNHQTNFSEPPKNFNPLTTEQLANIANGNVSMEKPKNRVFELEEDVPLDVLEERLRNETLDITEYNQIEERINKEKNKTRANTGRTKAARDYKPKGLDDIKEEDIIKVMYDWYLKMINGGASLVVKGIELGIVRGFEAIDRRLEKVSNSAELNKDVTPRSRFATQLTRYAKEKIEDVKDFAMGPKDLILAAKENIKNNTTDEISGLDPELKQRLLANIAGKSKEEISKEVDLAYSQQKSRDMLKAIKKPEAERSPEDIENIKFFPQEILEDMQQKLNSTDAPLSDEQALKLVAAMKSAAAANKQTIILGTAAKMIKKQQKGSKEFDNLSFDDNVAQIDRLFEFESIPLQESMYNKIKREPDMLRFEEDGSTKLSKIANLASRALDDEHEKAKGNSSFFKNGLKKFYESVGGITVGDIDREIEIEKAPVIEEIEPATNATPEQRRTRIDIENKHSGERRRRFQEAVNRMEARKQEGQNFDASRYIEERRGRQ